MATHRRSCVFRHLRRMALLQEGAGLNDEQLLDTFVVHREEAAFEALLRRHGPMVLGVCRRLLPDINDADDAFQATFLVLIRKAASIGKRELLANWLFGVARRTAMQVRKATARRRAKERQVQTVVQKKAIQDQAIQDLLPLLDQALSRLPDKYRVPIILCDLEGKTRREAARQLVLPEKTLATRLARARVMLAKRLAGHGLTLSGGVVAMTLSQSVASGSVPTSLVASTAKAATLLGAGKTVAAGVISAKVAALTEKVVKTMLLTKLKIATSVMLAVVVMGIGTGIITYRSQADEQKETKKEDSPKGDEGDSSKTGAAGLTPTIKERATLQNNLPVLSVAFSDDGKILATGDDVSIKLWDVLTAKELATLPCRGSNSLAFEPLGKTLISAGPDKTIKLWDVATTKELSTFTGHEGRVCSVAISSDGKTLASGSEDRTVRLWDLTTGKVRFTLKGHTGIVWCVAIKPDGKTLASASWDRTIRLWDVATGKETVSLQGHTDDIASLAFSKDGSTLISASGQMLKLWDVSKGKEKATLMDDGKFLSLATTSSGKLLFSGATNKTITVWDVAGGRKLATLTGHSDLVSALALAPNGMTLASGSFDGTIKLWDVGNRSGKGK